MVHRPFFRREMTVRQDTQLHRRGDSGIDRGDPLESRFVRPTMHEEGPTWLGTLLLVTGLAVAASGCEVMPDPEFAALESALTLSIVKATRGAGSTANFSFELTNRGTRSAVACLGPSRSVSYEGASSSGVSGTWVDHAGCVREFTIQSGDVMSWDETLEVPRLSEGRIQVEIGVQIVNPRRCGGWGNCAAIDLKSNRFAIPIARIQRSGSADGLPAIVLSETLATIFAVDHCEFVSGLTCRITYNGKRRLPSCVFFTEFAEDGKSAGPKVRLIYPRLDAGESGKATFRTRLDFPAKIVLVGEWHGPWQAPY